MSYSTSELFIQQMTVFIMWKVLFKIHLNLIFFEIIFTQESIKEKYGNTFSIQNKYILLFPESPICFLSFLVYSESLSLIEVANCGSCRKVDCCKITIRLWSTNACRGSVLDLLSYISKDYFPIQRKKSCHWFIWYDFFFANQLYYLSISSRWLLIYCLFFTVYFQDKKLYWTIANPLAYTFKIRHWIHYFLGFQNNVYCLGTSKTAIKIPEILLFCFIIGYTV